MEKQFKAKISTGSYIWAILMIILIISLSYDGIKIGRYLGTIALLLILSFGWSITFIWKKYIITPENLLIRSIWGIKKIPLSKIRKIERKTKEGFLINKYTILYPYREGMIIHYNTFDELFIGPGQSNFFVKELVKNNPNIEIFGKE